MRRLFLLVLVLGLCAVVVGAALAVLPPGGTFTDDDGNVHEGSIEAIAAEGITKGCNPPTNDRYCPDGLLTRGQTAAFMRRALSLPSSNIDYFVDDDDSVFEDDINAIAEAGITKGCNPPTSDRYCPNASITREQIAALLRRGFDYPAASIDYFTDDDSSIFEADINAIADAGVTLGCNPPTNDRYCPTALVKRDQMASFLSRALGLPRTTPTTTTSTSTTSTSTTSTSTTSTSTTSTSTTSTSTTTTTSLPPPEEVTFGDGVWVVGVDIAPGTYRSGEARPGLCRAARLSGFSGESEDVIARKSGYEPFIVTIEATDAGFSSTDCDLWTDDTTPRTWSPTADFDMGHWVVGDEVAPGLWQVGGAEWCIWQRLSGFSWERDDVIESGSILSSTVRIEATDIGFFGNEFCTFRYLG